jgi:hypothetical protein
MPSTTSVSNGCKEIAANLAQIVASYNQDNDAFNKLTKMQYGTQFADLWVQYDPAQGFSGNAQSNCAQINNVVTCATTDTSMLSESKYKQSCVTQANRINGWDGNISDIELSWFVKYTSGTYKNALKCSKGDARLSNEAERKSNATSSLNRSRPAVNATCQDCQQIINAISTNGNTQIGQIEQALTCIQNLNGSAPVSSVSGTGSGSVSGSTPKPLTIVMVVCSCLVCVCVLILMLGMLGVFAL